MIRGRKAALLVVCVLILIAPLLASANSTIADNDGDIFLSQYQEPYQNAFYILIPKGWKAEGGIVPSGVQWNVVDLVENNIRFRGTRPDGTSLFGSYPPAGPGRQPAKPPNAPDRHGNQPAAKPDPQ